MRVVAVSRVEALPQQHRHRLQPGGPALLGGHADACCKRLGHPRASTTRHGIAAIGLLVRPRKQTRHLGPRRHRIGSQGKGRRTTWQTRSCTFGVGARLVASRRHRCNSADRYLWRASTMHPRRRRRQPRSLRRHPRRRRRRQRRPLRQRQLPERLGEALRKGTANTKDKDGKEEKKELNICMTHHERIDGQQRHGDGVGGSPAAQVEGEPGQAAIS